MTPILSATLQPLDPTRLAERSAVQRGQSVDQAARGFESMFLSLLLKQMRQSLEPGTMFASDNSDILGGLFDSMMGDHLAKAGVLGIDRLVKAHWARAYEAAAAQEPR